MHASLPIIKGVLGEEGGWLLFVEQRVSLVPRLVFVFLQMKNKLAGDAATVEYVCQ